MCALYEYTLIMGNCAISCKHWRSTLGSDISSALLSYEYKYKTLRAKPFIMSCDGDFIITSRTNDTGSMRNPLSIALKSASSRLLGNAPKSSRYATSSNPKRLSAVNPFTTSSISIPR